MVGAFEPFDPVLRPIRALLAPELTVELQVTLWNAALGAWRTQSNPGLRRLTAPDAQRFEFERSGGEHAYFTERLSDHLSDLLVAVANSPSAPRFTRAVTR